MDLEVGGDSPWGDVPSQAQTTPAAAPKAGESTGEGESSGAASQASAPAATQPKAHAGRASRGPRRAGAQPVRLEALDDSLGPLGPLGDNAPTPQTDQPPAPPQKEQTVTHNIRQPVASSQSFATRTLLDSVNLGDEAEPTPGPRIPPPVQPSQGGPIRRDNNPSVSIEQAAKPTFDITVGDPHKVGDLTSSHIVYSVQTRTTSKAYRQPEFTVTRRYRDFLWLYNSLHANNPGIVVPPPPEKQAVGRFDTNFVESRRAALERMLNKTAAHPTLQHDGDLKLFLESEAFNVDVKHKERKEPSLGESKGMFSGLGISVGGGGKFVEHDDWFHERRIYLDALENQLKALLKAMDVVVTQRKGLAEAAGDFSGSLRALSAVELSASLSGPLESLADLQIRIRELYDRQAQQDVLTLGITIDEYIRLIGSIKQAFTSRQNAYHSWHSAEASLQKRKATQEKLLRQGKSQQDRLNQMQGEVADAEKKVHQARLLFEDMGRLMKTELDRFEREKVEDFKSAVETFLESAVEAQKELIELWETFLMQLDAEEDEHAFYKPPVEPAARASSETGMSGETATESQAAAVATAEEEDE
ncbi:sorting nexin 3 protein [Rutstroemia sp. NJR-2017a WRK4]|nr:sorting nexin 3 protein [Rutstroemia sp. NJR-2017a WRK4]